MRPEEEEPVCKYLGDEPLLGKERAGGDLEGAELELGEQCEEGMRRDQTGGRALWATLGCLG